MNISVIGLGKVGSAMVAVFASKGFDIWGYDTNKTTLDSLRKNLPIIPEPGVANLLSTHKEKIEFTETLSEAVDNSEISFIIVPTPSDHQGFFDSTFVEDAIIGIINALKPNKRHAIVVSSTIMPGAMKRISANISALIFANDISIDIQLIYSPEFIALGNVVNNLLKPQFCLIGSDSNILESDRWAASLTSDIKSRITNAEAPIHMVTFESAEIAKISCNTFLTTKITYANLISQLTDKIPGANVGEVFEVLHSDDRIGSRFFSPGLGYGGPCLPRDNRALGNLLDQLQIPSALPFATHDFNESLVIQILNSSKANQLSEGDSLVILGLAYKIDTSSLIESHALKIANAFQKKGIAVRAHDFLVDFSSKELNFLDHGSNSLDKKLLENAQGILISHGDPRYREFLSGEIINNKILIDPWGIIDGF